MPTTSSRRARRSKNPPNTDGVPGGVGWGWCESENEQNVLSLSPRGTPLDFRRGERPRRPPIGYKSTRLRFRHGRVEPPPSKREGALRRGRPQTFEQNRSALEAFTVPRSSSGRRRSGRTAEDSKQSAEKGLRRVPPHRAEPRRMHRRRRDRLGGRSRVGRDRHGLAAVPRDRLAALPLASDAARRVHPDTLARFASAVDRRAVVPCRTPRYRCVFRRLARSESHSPGSRDRDTDTGYRQFAFRHSSPFLVERAARFRPPSTHPTSPPHVSCSASRPGSTFVPSIGPPASFRRDAPDETLARLMAYIERHFHPHFPSVDSLRRLGYPPRYI